MEIKNAETYKQLEKELSIIPEPGTGSDHGKLNREKREIFQNYRVTNAREVKQLTETMKQKVQAKAQKIRRYEKRKPSLVKIRCLRKTQNTTIETWA